MEFNFADLFEAVADSVPQRQALVCGERKRSYNELEATANQLAHYLAAQGIEAGDRVGLYLLNGIEYVEALLACFKIRAVPVNINYRYVDAELAQLLGKADLAACIFHRRFAPQMETARTAGVAPALLLEVDDGGGGDSLGSATDYLAAVQHQPALRQFMPRSGDDHYLLFTGGTTGLPKAVLWSHRALFFAAIGGGGYFSQLGPCQSPEDIGSRISPHGMSGIALAPLMHGAAQWFALSVLLGGNTLVLLEPGSFDAERAWHVIAEQRCQLIQLVGDAMAVPLLEALAAFPNRWDLSSVMLIGSGGALFSPTQQRGFKARFPKAFVSNSFGSSEGGQIGMDTRPRPDAHQLASLAPRPDMAVLTGAAGSYRHAARGELGQLARCGHIPLGYFRDAQATAQAFVEVEGVRWLLTGDVACEEEDGTLSVFGRGSACIDSGGEKVFPEEVETVLKAHPDVADALVIGVPDSRWGQRVCAVVRAAPARTLAVSALLGFCRRHLASYKLPREFHLTADIPRGAAGKPDYAAARRYVEEGAGRIGKAPRRKKGAQP